MPEDRDGRVRTGHIALGPRRTPASRIARAADSGVDTSQRVHGFDTSSSAGKPSVAMNPGWTRPTWTPCSRSSAQSASDHPASANFDAL